MPKAKAAVRTTVATAGQVAQANRTLHAVPSADESRRAAMRQYRPMNGYHVPTSVQELVIDLIMQTPHKSGERDRKLLAAALDNAAYDLHVHGGYDPARAMTESALEQWKKDDLARRGVTPRSQGDYSSLMRAVAKANGFAPHLAARRPSPRGTAAAPANKASWGRLIARAAQLPSHLRIDVTMTADLAYGAGLRAEEIARAKGADLSLLPHGEGRLCVANRRGEIREIPVGPLVTSRMLAAQRRASDFLVRPDNSRHNVLNRMFERAEGQVAGIKFNLNAARNRYIVDLLSEPIPFRAVCLLADLNSGGHTAQDLARYATLPSQRDVEEMVRRTWR